MVGHIIQCSFQKCERVLRADYLLSTSTVLRRPEFNPEEASAFLGWLKALFDSNSEGIDDSILRYVLSFYY